MNVRAKFMLTEIRQNHYGGVGRTLIFTPQYDQNIPEDRRFAQATPNGEFRMHVDNPSALAVFELGKQYYVDFAPVEVPVSA